MRANACWSLVLLLALQGCAAPRTASNSQAQKQETSTRSARTPGQAFLEQHYNQLMGFIDKADFHLYGFAVGGKYHSWLKTIDAKYKNNDFAFQEKVTINYLRQLGTDYMRSNGAETSYTRRMTREVKDAIAGKEWE